MATTQFRRQPRQSGPPLPSGEIQLQEPPALPDEAAGQLSNVMLYLPMVAGAAGMALFFTSSGSGGGGVHLLASGLMAVSMIGMAAGAFVRNGGSRKRELNSARRHFIRYLSQTREKMRTSIAEQREALLWLHPDPHHLLSRVRGSRLWERRASDDDFAEIRLAVGRQLPAPKLLPPETAPVEDLEPLSAIALRRFLQLYSSVPDLPVAVNLRAYARVLLDGVDDAPAGLARAVIAQLVAVHSAEDLRIVVCVRPDRRNQWEWVKWLPHNQHPTDSDAAGPVRMVTDSYSGLEKLIGTGELEDRPRFEPYSAPSSDEPYYVVILDGVTVPTGGRLAGAGTRNLTVIDVDGALAWRSDRISLRLRLSADKIAVVGSARSGKDSVDTIGKPDTVSTLTCRALAKSLARYGTNGTFDSGAALKADVQLTSLLGIPDARTFDPHTLWQNRSMSNRLRVPIGVDEQGAPVELDIKESAQGGMGPHGMLVGATGSGKSELLRTLVLAMAATHSSEVLNFVLVDFKGGATFLGLDNLPHTSAIITNLADELPLVDRMQDALHGELVRRQEVLRAAGFASLLEYEKARAAGGDLRPLPTLFLVIDEFSELLAAKREFINLFVMVGRLGRSLGVHLLLATQRLDEGRVHQLEGHLSYRIGLRMFSAMESRGVLGVTDAYDMPLSPGSGFLKTDTTTLVRFKAAFVGGTVKSPGDRRAVSRRVRRELLPYTTHFIAPPATPAEDLLEPEPEEPQDGESRTTLLRALAERLTDAGPPAHPVWMPPLTHPPTLDAMLPGIVVEEGIGLIAAGWPGRHGLQVPVGIIDKPFEQRWDLLLADLGASGGNVGIVGGPRSGKSNLIRTLILALALTHTPHEVQFYCLDFGGGGLAVLNGLPHVGTVAGRRDIERTRRMLVEIDSIITQREKTFTERGIDSIAAYRQMRATGVVTDDPYGDVFLVVDGWFTLRQDFEELEPLFQRIASRGLGYGVHLVVSAHRWSELRPWLRDVLGTKFELHLGDPLESVVGSRMAANVPAVPGRGLTVDSLHFLAGLPRVDGGVDVAGLTEATGSAIEMIAQYWPGGKAPGVRTLPAVLDVRELPGPDAQLPVSAGLRMPIGLNEAGLDVMWHDFDQHPHLMVFGDTESGKTNLLRLVADAVVSRYSPDAAQILLADVRRELFSAVPADYQLGYAISSGSLKQIIAEAAPPVTERLPGPGITPEQLRRRDWWSGPRLFILIDDYDLVAGNNYDSPLAPLLDLLAQGTDIGLHLIVARSTAGAARAMMEPTLRRLWDLATPAVLLSCSKEEGAFLGGVRPQQLPPGRGHYVNRRTATLLQTAYVPDAVSASTTR